MELKKPFVFDETNVLHKDFGDTKREVLEKLGTTLSLGGLLPFAGTTKSIRIIDENTLEAYSEARKVKSSSANWLYLTKLEYKTYQKWQKG